MINVPSVINYTELPQRISLPNPKGRKIVIKPEESGRDREQMFTSKCLPDVIPYELLGLIKFPDGSVYPKYRANVVTKEKLWLEGENGYENAISIINKVAWCLTWQERMLEAKSIKWSDLKYFDYESEELSYWLASLNSYEYYRDFYEYGLGSGKVDYGEVSYTGSLIFNHIGMYGRAVRPVMVLASKVKIDSSEITWVEL